MSTYHQNAIFSAGMFLLKVNNRNTRKSYEICSKLAKRHQNDATPNANTWTKLQKNERRGFLAGNQESDWKNNFEYNKGNNALVVN